MTSDPTVKKEAIASFRLLQQYMGERKLNVRAASANKSSTISNGPTAVRNAASDALDECARQICLKGWSRCELRDEIFLQICKQSTDNRKQEGVRRAWELLAISLSFFAPTPSFFAHLHAYITRHLTPPFADSLSHYAAYCLKKLERHAESRRGVGSVGRKPSSPEEISLARRHIFYPSQFGNTLDELMALQRERCPDRQLPWVLTALSEAVLRLGGEETEGIFRVPADIDQVNALKHRLVILL